MTHSVSPVSAQVTIDDTLHPQYAPVVVIEGKNKSAADYGNYFLQLIAGGLLYLAAPTAVLFIAISGFRYVTSRGDQNAIEEAKKTLEWAIIGLIVVIFSYAAVRIIISTVLSTPTATQTVTSPTAPSTPSGGSATPGGDNPSGGAAKPPSG
jgi:hypothetical protein